MLYNNQPVTSINFNSQSVDRLFVDGELAFIDTDSIDAPTPATTLKSSMIYPEYISNLLVPQDWSGTGDIPNMGYNGAFTAYGNVTKDSVTGAFRFNGDNLSTSPNAHDGYLSADHSTLMNDKNKTVAMWVKPDYDKFTIPSVGLMSNAYVNQGNGSTNNNGFLISMGHENGYKFASHVQHSLLNGTNTRTQYGAFGPGGNNVALLQNIDLGGFYNEWTCLTFVFWGDDIYFYRNGILVSMTQGDQEMYKNSGFSDRRMVIGAQATYDNYPTDYVQNITRSFAGQIGHVITWDNLALGTNNARDFYNNTKDYYEQFNSRKVINIDGATVSGCWTLGSRPMADNTVDNRYTPWFMNCTTWQAAGYADFNLGSSTKLTGYRVWSTMINTNGYNDYSLYRALPRSWVLQGSTDGTNWITLDYVSDATFPQTANVSSVYGSATAPSYYMRHGTYVERSLDAAQYPAAVADFQYYRLYVYSNNGNTWTTIGEVQLLS